MIILHIASIRNNPYNGVDVVIPHYIRFQKEAGHVLGFINVNEERIREIDCQIEIKGKWKLNQLPVLFQHPDIVVFHECYRKEYLYIWRQLYSRKIPYIIVPHGALGKQAQKKKRLKKIMGNLFFFNGFIEHASGLQMLSEIEYNETLFKGFKFLASNGVSIPERRKAGFNKQLEFIYIGRLDAYHKGLDIMIEAIAKIRSNLKDDSVHFSIYGPDYRGRLMHLLDLIKKNNVEEFVSVHDPITGDDKIQTLLDADIFIQTSRFEGMPLGVLEALSYGVPCLVTEGTNLGKEIEEYRAGWVAETNSDSVAHAISRVVDDRCFYGEYSDNGIKLVKDCFSWESITEKTLDIYKDLIRNV